MTDIEQTIVAFQSGGFAAVRAAFPDVPAGTLRTRLRRAGLHTPRKTATRAWGTPELRELARLRSEGFTSAQIAKRLKRSKYSIDGQVKQQLKSKQMPRRAAERRPWTPGTRRVVDQSVDQMIGHLAMRLDRTPDALMHEITRSLRGYRTRHSAIAKQAIAV